MAESKLILYPYRVARDANIGGGSVIIYERNRNQAMRAARRKMGWRSFGSSRDGGFRGYSVELVRAVADSQPEGRP